MNFLPSFCLRSLDFWIDTFWDTLGNLEAALVVNMWLGRLHLLPD